MNALNQVSSIKRSSLHEELTGRLRRMIVEGVLATGEKVPEKGLCKKDGALLGSILKRHLMNNFSTVRQWLQEQAASDSNTYANS